MIDSDLSLRSASRAFQALADETRLKIIGLLADGELCVCDLAGALDVPQPLLSFHLKTLRDAGLARTRREGRWVHYSLDGDAFEDLKHVIAAGIESNSGANPCQC